METLDTEKEFIELRAKGWSYDKIAAKLGKSKQALIDWSKELEEEIANLKALELEALYETYHLYKENRLKTFAEILNNLKEELVSRDLSDVPTEKLLDLFLKYSKQVEEELVEPSFKSSQEIIEQKEERNLLEGVDLGKLTDQEIRDLAEIQNKLLKTG